MVAAAAAAAAAAALNSPNYMSRDPPDFHYQIHYHRLVASLCFSLHEIHVRWEDDHSSVEIDSSTCLVLPSLLVEEHVVRETFVRRTNQRSTS